jgi:hypothetical protein
MTIIALRHRDQYHKRHQVICSKTGFFFVFCLLLLTVCPNGICASLPKHSNTKIQNFYPNKSKVCDVRENQNFTENLFECSDFRRNVADSTLLWRFDALSLGKRDPTLWGYIMTSSSGFEISNFPRRRWETRRKLYSQNLREEKTWQNEA